jgi:hypothetical protein
MRIFRQLVSVSTEWLKFLGVCMKSSTTLIVCDSHTTVLSLEFYMPLYVMPDFVFHPKDRTLIEDVWKQIAEEDISIKESNRITEKTV